MWSPSQITRTPSNHSASYSVASMASMASSTSSRGSPFSQHAAYSPESDYGEQEQEGHLDFDHDGEGVIPALYHHQDDKPQQQILSPQQLNPIAFNADEVPLWGTKKKTLPLNSKEHFLAAAQQHHKLHESLELQRQRTESIASDDTHATLAEEGEHQKPHDVDMDLKTPTVPNMKVSEEVTPAFVAAGPMSQLLHSLLLKVADVERAQPTVMAEDYAALQTRVAELERENQSNLQTYNDLLALRNDDLMNIIKVRGLLAEEKREHASFRQLRDDDISNLIKVRGFLAEEKREHAAIRQLRDDDLGNVLMLREQLAKATWTAKMQVSTTPPLERRQTLSQGAESTTPVNKRASKSDSDDLWRQAKTAAMEQRVLELEKANAELRAAQSTAPTAPTAPTTTTVVSTGSGDNLLSRVENMFEDSLKQREKMATKVQQLRSEKEVLQKEVATLEDRNNELEALVERLKRGMKVNH